MYKTENVSDIPNEFRHAHEEGNVVFFCGAGISCHAKLPLFKGLVEEVYRRSKLRDEYIDSAIENEKLDFALELIEEKYAGGAIEIRKIIRSILLEVDYTDQDAKSLHTSILKLSKSSDGSIKLLTTNCDRIFEDVKKEIIQSEKAKSYVAPLLPVQKKQKWNGIIYLHGLIPESVEDEESLNNLVFTPGDFGLAYLTERWASRFLSDLFRDYTICFVGYSLNDPILKYIVDALAADSLKGENYNKPYIFLAEEEVLKNHWYAKKLIPITYKNSDKKHKKLVEIFEKWTTYKENGLTGRQKEVLRLLQYTPKTPEEEKEIIENMTWGLMEKTGKVAEYFANSNPVPDITWLDAFENSEYDNLNLWGIKEYAKNIKDLKISLLNRPVPLMDSPKMSLIVNRKYTYLDNINIHIAKWLTRHLNDFKLVDWVIKSNGNLHPIFKDIIKEKLDKLYKLTEKEKAEILKDAPNAIPNEEMAEIWNFISKGYLDSELSRDEHYTLYSSLITEYNSAGMSFCFIDKLRKLLIPKIKISKAIHWHMISQEPKKNIFNLTVFLPNFEFSYMYKKLTQIKDFDLLICELERILKDTLCLLSEIKDSLSSSSVQYKLDRSPFNIKSIEPHWQNKHFSDNWTCLIELLRDSWLKVLEKDVLKAKDIALSWFDVPYLAFKRLALYASSKCDEIPSAVWLEYLLKDNAFLLWSSLSQREVLRLLYLKAKNLPEEELLLLEEAILKGSPRSKFKKNISRTKLIKIRKKEKIHHLAKIKNGGGKLSTKALEFFERNKLNFPDYAKETKHNKDEFPIWSFGTGDPDYKESKVKEKVPKEVKDLGIWIKKPEKDAYGYSDDFKNTCKESPLLVIRAFLYILNDLDNKNVQNRLIDALYIWGDNKHCAELSWRCFCIIKGSNSIKNNISEELAHAISRWLDGVRNYNRVLGDNFLDLSKIILYRDSSSSNINLDGDLNNIMTYVINDPTGIISENLIKAWLKTKPIQGTSIATEFKVVFEELASSVEDKFIYSKVILGNFLNVFYYFDEEWTIDKLLPLFDFSKNSDTAKAMWIGFFLRNQVDTRVIFGVKPYFKDIFHNGHINKYLRENAISFLFYCWLNNIDILTETELSKIFGDFKLEDWEFSSRILYNTIHSLNESKDSFWEKTIKGFFDKYWSRSADMKSSTLSMRLFMICLEFNAELKDSVNMLINYIGEIDYGSGVNYHLKQKELNPENIDSILELVAKIWQPNDLNKDDLLKFLVRVNELNLDLQNNKAYLKLKNITN